MFCPECGSSDKEMIDNICIDCFLKDFQLLTIPPHINVTVCSHCNSKLEEGKWIESNIPTEEIIYRALERNIKLEEIAKEEIIDLKINKMRGSIAECTIEAEAKVLNETIQETHKTNVQIKKSACPTCSKRNSGYYEAVIQLRADERELTSEEKVYAEEIIFNTLNKLFKKDKLAYIAEKLNPKEGTDYYIGSYKSAKKVLTSLRKNFGGIVKESPRLISQDKSTGKGLYRIWISLRLPKFQIGDFIKYNNRVGQILFIDNDKGIGIDLNTNENFSLPWNKYNNIEILKKREEIETTSIISKSPNMIQILEPNTYSAIDLEMKNIYKNLNIGDEIELINKIKKQYS